MADAPLLGRLFARNHTETQQTDIVLTLTPDLVRVLDLSEDDLGSFRVGKDIGPPIVELPGAEMPPWDPIKEPPGPVIK